MVSMRSMLAYFLSDTPRVACFVISCGLVLLLAWCKHLPAMCRLRDQAVVPGWAVIVAVLNPVSAHFLVNYAAETQTLRFIWMIPVAVIISCVIVELVFCLKARWARRFTVAVAALVLALTAARDLPQMKTYWEGPNRNWYKVPEVVMELCDYIAKDDTNEVKMAVFPFPLNLWVRQYRPEIRLPFAWTEREDTDMENVWMYEDLYMLEEGVPDWTDLAEHAEKGGYRYIILPDHEPHTGHVEDSGYEPVYHIQTDEMGDYGKKYTLYRKEGGTEK